MLQDSRTGKDFLDKAPKTQEIKAKLDKCNYIKLKGCPAKEATKSVETAKLGGQEVQAVHLAALELKNSLPKRGKS